MTAFLLIGEGAKAFVYAWTVLLLVLCLYNSVNAIYVGSRFYIPVFAVLSLVLYFEFQLEHDLILYTKGSQCLRLTYWLGSLPHLWWLLWHILMTVLAVLLTGNRLQWEKKHINPNSIQIAMDSMPFGICCYTDNGHVVFANAVMDELCMEITGQALMNGFELSNAVHESNITLNGITWHFTHDRIAYHGVNLFEIIASDVTSEYTATEKLICGNEELKRMNAEMRKYNQNIDDTIRSREVLTAKMTIHDEMNKVMLAGIAAAESKETEKLNDVLNLWNRNMLVFFKNSGEFSRHSREEITALAELLGIKLSWSGCNEGSLAPEAADVVYKAAREAISNAAKHAHAKQIDITFSETDADITVLLSNDGMRHEGDTVFGGGLRNLEEVAGRIGGSLSVTDAGRYTLVLTLPKK